MTTRPGDHPDPDEDWMPKVRTPENDPSLRVPEELRKPISGVAQNAAERVRGKDEPSALVGIGKAWGTALDFIFTIAAGAVLGWLFDRWRGSTPTGSLIGFACGFVLALVRIIRATLRQERLEQEAKSKARAVCRKP
jgi:F0F1-type ATP synthase assembly protein I